MNIAQDMQKICKKLRLKINLDHCHSLIEEFPYTII